MTPLLDLRELRGPEHRVDRSYQPAAFPVDRNSDYTVADTVSLALHVRKDGEKYRLFGRVRTVLSLSCGRCLEPFDVQSEIMVDLLYLPQSANNGEAEGEIREDDLSTAFYRDDHIDLCQMAQEQFQLALPMKPLCRDECRGLCSICGCNLNQQNCPCDVHWHDPRLAGLKNFLVSGPRDTGSRRTPGG